MNYKIVSSGSNNGNCVIINDVMVDCGVAFKTIKKDLYDIKYLLLTHIHSDHIKQKTLQLINEEFPTITVIGNHEVHQAWNCNIIANAGFDIQTDDYTFTPFECIHDVLTYGYVWEAEGQRILYCTDTGSMENAPDGFYDYFFLESNHDEKKLEAVRSQKKGNYSPYLSGKRHLSTQAAKAFYFMHRRSPSSEFIELHKSDRFY
jgi:phosphoribosyl 1,2-cyclic phosphodiesterase